MQVLKLKCADEFVPYNSYGTGVEPTSDCYLRTTRLSQEIGCGIDFGMVMSKNHHYNSAVELLGLNTHGFGGYYGTHAWGLEGDTIYESCRQLEEIAKHDGHNYKFDFDKPVAYFDISFMPVKNDNQVKNLFRYVSKCLEKADRAGFDVVYFSGYGEFQGRFYTPETFNNIIDDAEKVLECYDNGQEVPQYF